jgi:hypothetical protein
MAARDVLFRDYGYDHQMTVFGDISPELRALFVRHAGGVGEYVFLDGLGQVSAV